MITLSLQKKCRPAEPWHRTVHIIMCDKVPTHSKELTVHLHLISLPRHYLLSLSSSKAGVWGTPDPGPRASLAWPFTSVVQVFVNTIISSTVVSEHFFYLRIFNNKGFFCPPQPQKSLWSARGKTRDKLFVCKLSKDSLPTEMETRLQGTLKKYTVGFHIISQIRSR